MTDDVSLRKRALRAELRERRRTRTSTERAADDSQLTQQLETLTERLGVTYLAAYLSTPDEPPTREFLSWACGRGIRVILPISRADGLLDWAPYDASDEMADIQGMPAPTSDVLSPMTINDVGLILVPAATVDRSGMRMGWGQGYFDRTLGSMEACPPVYAVIFDEELVDSVPSEVHDKRVNGVVTPSGVVRFS
jgi:5-formyltetrahydrofolate cyclo-ligase